MKNADMHDAEYQNLMEASWRRPLTAAERARMRELLAAHPEFRQSWEEEAALNGLIRQLPAPAISTNFTARVLAAARRLPAKPAWRRRLELFAWPSAGWVPRAALGVAMICCGLLSNHQYQTLRRAQVAREMAGASRLAELTSMDWLENFDTINGLNKVNVADQDLLTVLQ
jgi:anti-sigma factor RsiW